MKFVEALNEGLLGESEITKWLNSRGWDVLPAYEVEIDRGKGPRLFTANHGTLITPDLLIFKNADIIWVEAKTKSAFTWHRKTASWQTGIDKRHWEDYQAVNMLYEFPLWLFFLHKPGTDAKDTPEGAVSPTGLYGQEIGLLEQSVDHKHENHGPSGMVYWREESLRKLCNYADFLNG